MMMVVMCVAHDNDAALRNGVHADADDDDTAVAWEVWRSNTWLACAVGAAKLMRALHEARHRGAWQLVLGLRRVWGQVIQANMGGMPWGACTIRGGHERHAPCWV